MVYDVLKGLLIGRLWSTKDDAQVGQQQSCLNEQKYGECDLGFELSQSEMGYSLNSGGNDQIEQGQSHN